MRDIHAIIEPLVIAPGTLVRAPSSTLFSGNFTSVKCDGRFFAGQPDPNDESHFTIDYEVDGIRNTIDGWLLDDDTVKLEPRPLPTTLPR